jgi:tripartite-type tricarboxylate transporter receptor subunit TctC
MVEHGCRLGYVIFPQIGFRQHNLNTKSVHSHCTLASYGRSAPLYMQVFTCSAPAMTDLMAGHVAYLFGGISAAVPHTVSGKLRALAVSTAKRSAAVPDIPTIAESGLAGYQMNTWNSLVVPRGTPAPIIQRLNTEVGAVLNEPEVKERMKQQGIDPDPGTPAQLAAFIKSEVARFDNLIKAIGLKPE